MKNMKMLLLFSFFVSPTVSIITNEIGANDMCFLPKGFPNSVVDNVDELHICGTLVDKDCPTSDCACFLDALKTPRYGDIVSFQKMYNTHPPMRQRLGIKPNLKNPNSLKDPLIVMYVNYGYFFMLQNWLCSCEKNGIDVRKSLLVVAGDEKSEEILRRLRINYISAGKLYLRKTSWTITEEAPERFGLGSHAAINVVGLSVLTDLINLGRSVIYQDVDIIWENDPREYLLFGSKQADIRMMFDANGSPIRSPGNSGFIYILNNCRTKIFMNTLMKYIWITQYFGGSDQCLWNVLLKSKPFRLLSFTTFPEEKYINGHILVRKLKNKEKDLGNYSVLHASWTHNWVAKKEMLQFFGHWYLYKNNTCTYNSNVFLPPPPMIDKE